MARYAIVEDTKVVNVVVWNGPGKRPARHQHRRWPSRTKRVTPQLPDPAFRGRPIEIIQDGGIGWTYEDGEFIPPPDE